MSRAVEFQIPLEMDARRTMLQVRRRPAGAEIAR
jgi:hypothetical protein